MLRKLRKLIKNQPGFTLLEVAIAVALTGILSSTVIWSTFQVIDNNSYSIARMSAVKQVEVVIHFLRQDIQMAQTVTPSGGTGFPLFLQWVDWENTTNNVTYSLSGGNLQRLHSRTDTSMVTSNSTLVANNIQNISVTFVKHEIYDPGVYQFTITANITGRRSAIETRVFEIFPRTSH